MKQIAKQMMITFILWGLIIATAIIVNPDSISGLHYKSSMLNTTSKITNNNLADITVISSEDTNSSPTIETNQTEIITEPISNSTIENNTITTSTTTNTKTNTVRLSSHYTNGYTSTTRQIVHGGTPVQITTNTKSHYTNGYD